MARRLSNTQIDRLGDRLRQGGLAESDLRLLDDYRRSFGEAYEMVVEMMRERLGLEPTGRSAKSTGSLIEKLRRESLRLTQVQDIAGCRVIVADVAEQDRVVASLRSLFPDGSVVDRRTNPSHGYRAVHVIVSISGKLIEVQVRTMLQHLWAELSEKMSDLIDPTIKYGGGDKQTRAVLKYISESVATGEAVERITVRLLENLVGTEAREQMARFQLQHSENRRNLVRGLNESIAQITDLPRKPR